MLQKVRLGENMKILVTGGAGFIGHHLVTDLLQKQCQVNILDVVDISDNRVEYLVSLGANYFQGDITNYEDIIEAGRGCDHVVHLAAQISVPRSIQEPGLNDSINIHGTRNVIQFANNSSIRKIIFSSSAAVYGDCETNPIKEDYKGELQSPYAISKLQNEKDLLNLVDESICVHILRFFNVYGSGQNLSSGYGAVIPSFIKSLSLGNSPIIYGDGNQTRDFIHVSDVVGLITKIILKHNTQTRGCYNVATQKETSVLQLFETIRIILVENFDYDPLPDAIFQSKRAGDIDRSFADISATKAHHIWSPKISIEQGLRALIQHQLGDD